MAETINFIGTFKASKGGGPIEQYSMTEFKDVKVSGDIYTVPWTDWTASVSWTGIDDWTGGFNTVYYKKIGSIVIVQIATLGHLNAGSAVLDMSLPYASSNTVVFGGPILVNDAGLVPGSYYFAASATVKFSVGSALNSDNFNDAAGSPKGVYGQLIYHTSL